MKPRLNPIAVPACTSPAELADDALDCPACPECGNETFYFDDPDTGPELTCLDCIAFTISDD